MTDTIETLRRLHAEATQGPWSVEYYDAGDKDEWDECPSIQGPESEDCAVVHWAGFKQRYWKSARGDQRAIDANAALIVAMHAALPKLLACVEALEPFARSSERDWDDDAPDDTEVWSSQGSGWPTSKSCFDVGDLRRAARALASLKEPAQ